MSEIQAIEDAPRPRRMRNGLILAGAAFVAGIGLTGWAVTSWQPAKNFVAPDTEATALTAPTRTTPQPLAGSTPATAQPLAIPQSLTDVRLAAVEARLSSLAQAANGPLGNSRRAEGLLLAFAARRALDRGLSLGYLEPELTDYFGATQPKAVAQVIAASRAPVTQAALSAELDRIAPTLSSPPANEGVFETIRRELAGLFIVRKEGASPIATPDRIELARELLKIGRVDQAMAEIARLDRSGKAGDWLAKARRYVEANSALDILEAAVLVTPKAESPQPPAEASPSVVVPVPAAPNSPTSPASNSTPSI